MNSSLSPARWMMPGALQPSGDETMPEVVFEAFLRLPSDVSVGSASDEERRDSARAMCAGFALAQYREIARVRR